MQKIVIFLLFFLITFFAPYQTLSAICFESVSVKLHYLIFVFLKKLSRDILFHFPLANILGFQRVFALCKCITNLACQESRLDCQEGGEKKREKRLTLLRRHLVSGSRDRPQSHGCRTWSFVVVVAMGGFCFSFVLMTMMMMERMMFC